MSSSVSIHGPAGLFLDSPSIRSVLTLNLGITFTSNIKGLLANSSQQKQDGRPEAACLYPQTHEVHGDDGLDGRVLRLSEHGDRGRELQAEVVPV